MVANFVIVGLILLVVGKKCDKLGLDENGIKLCKKGCAHPYISSWNPDECKKCKEVKDEKICDDGFSANVGCIWKKGKCKSNSCPKIAKHLQTTNSGSDHDRFKKLCKNYGCFYSKKLEKCTGLARWALALILILIILFLIAVVVVIIVIILLLKKKKTTPDKVEVQPTSDPTLEKTDAVRGTGDTGETETAEPTEPTEPADGGEAGEVAERAATDGGVVEVGPYVVIKIGAKQHKTRKVNNAQDLVWEETLEFTGLSGEDDDMVVELWGDTDLVGTLSMRLPEYVNNKKRVSTPVKNSEGAETGTLELDVEVIVQEEPVVEIKAVFYVDKGHIN